MENIGIAKMPTHPRTHPTQLGSQSGASEIRSLSLSANHLRTLPSTFFAAMSTLTCLTLRNNRMVDFPEEVAKALPKYASLPQVR